MVESRRERIECNGILGVGRRLRRDFYHRIGENTLDECARRNARAADRRAGSDWMRICGSSDENRRTLRTPPCSRLGFACRNGAENTEVGVSARIDLVRRGEVGAYRRRALGVQVGAMFICVARHGEAVVEIERAAHRQVLHIGVVRVLNVREQLRIDQPVRRVYGRLQSPAYKHKPVSRHHIVDGSPVSAERMQRQRIRHADVPCSDVVRGIGVEVGIRI